jgi:hypothetical protein
LKALATALAAVLGGTVQALEIPRNQWGARLAAMGFVPREATAHAEMLDGYKSGWIGFGVPARNP